MTAMTGAPAPAEFVYIRHCYSEDAHGNLRTICGKGAFAYPDALNAYAVNAVYCRGCHYWIAMPPAELHPLGRVDVELNTYHRTRQAYGLR